MIELQPFTHEDFNQLISWVETPELLMTIAGPRYHFPLTHAQLEEYLKDDLSLSYKVVETSTGLSVGHAEIYLLGNGRCKIDKVLVGDKSMRGKGIGYELMTRITEQAFHLSGILEVELNVYDWNTSAINVYKRTGYEIVPGKDSWNEINGEKWRAFNMTVNSSTWDAKHGKQ